MVVPMQQTMDQIREHYTVEKELAARLRSASREERTRLYTTLYNELYCRLPHHPRLTRKNSAEETRLAVARQMALMEPFLGKDTTFLEVGPGDCSYSAAVAAKVRQVYAIDVSDVMVRGVQPPPNLEFVVSDGSSIELAPGTVDLAYSHQVMEHLHPDDAVRQLHNIYKALAAGGKYVCITPNRLFGPHDVSKHFDEVATGFHLKEYTLGELNRMLLQVGFCRVRAAFGAKGRYLLLAPPLLAAVERLLELIPHRARRRLGDVLPFRLLCDVRLVAVK